CSSDVSQPRVETSRPLLGNLHQRRCRPARLPTVLLPILERAHRNAQKVSKPGLTQPNFLTRLNNGWQINGTNRANSPRLDILDGVECFLPDIPIQITLDKLFFIHSHQPAPLSKP